MDNFEYTISIIENNNKIERLYYSNKEAADNIYKALYMIARYYVCDIEGIQLWQHRKGKTIDNDARARIIEQYYKA
jgi:hypothetical protein